MKGSDHAASLEPQGLFKMVRDIRAIEAALGDGKKILYDQEIPIRQKLAKSVVSTTELPAGIELTREMLTTKGPGTGIPASALQKLVGKRTRRAIPGDAVLHEEDIDWDWV
jgi:sialic acid synthase SpsE